MTTPQTFRKKPVEIQAVRLGWDNWDDMCAFAPVGANGCRGVWVADDGTWSDEKNGDRLGLLIPTLEGEMLGVEGDWIIRGVQGEFYPCKPDIFEQTYVNAESDGTEEHVHHTVFALRLPNGDISCRTRVALDADPEKVGSTIADLKKRAEGKALDARYLGVTDYTADIVTSAEHIVISTGPWADVVTVAP